MLRQTTTQQQLKLKEELKWKTKNTSAKLLNLEQT
jgi:hypothetical protein